MSTSRSLYVLAIALMASTVLQIGDLALRPGVPVFGDGNVPIGEELDLDLVDASGLVRDLGTIDPGKCRYVVVGSHTCKYCDDLQLAWTVAHLNNHAEGVFRHSRWSLLWIMREPVPNGFFDPAFPSPYYVAADGSALMQQTGANGIPFHVTVDEQGRITGGGLGASLPTKEQLAADCTITMPKT